jgi:DNA-binding transcriptional LysR family regulator
MRHAHIDAAQHQRSSDERRQLLALMPQLSLLLTERHVSRAAVRAGVTQPTMSRALASARQLLGDALLIRTRRGTVLTPRAEQLQVALDDVLARFDGLWASPPGEAQQARGLLRIVATDYVSQTHLPTWVAKLRRAAPKLTLELLPWSGDAMGMIEADEVQLGLNPLGQAPQGFFRKRVAEDAYVVILAKRHPAARSELGLAEFTSYAHVLTSTEGGQVGPVDALLRRKRMSRQIAVRVRDFATAAAVVGASDMISTVPRRLALDVQQRFKLVLRKPPLELPAIGIELIWHERRQRDPLLAWVRSQLV